MASVTLYPRYVRLKDGSKVLVQTQVEHEALTGLARGESARAVAGHADDPEEPEESGDDPEQELDTEYGRNPPGKTKVARKK